MFTCSDFQKERGHIIRLIMNPLRMLLPGKNGEAKVDHDILENVFTEKTQ